MAVAELDIDQIRRDFPLLSRQVRGKPLVYLDNAATTQKPRAVIEAVDRFYSERCSNVHRGLHHLSELATADFEESRNQLQRFIGAAESRELIFTRGTTESINLLARSFGEAHVRTGDEIVLSEMEHHSNIVPWQLLCERTGAVLRVIPIDDDGSLVLDDYASMLGPRTKLVAVSHTSNALGTRNPVEQMIEMAHAQSIPVLLDGAQAVPHEPVDVQALDCDFFAFSGHKMFGPTGIGALYGKAERLEQLPPFLGGGEMINTVSFEGTTFKGLPHRFEAGTPDIAGAIGLGAAAAYLETIGMDRIASMESDLLDYGTRQLEQVPGLRMIGTARRKASILGFTVDGIHPHDLGTALDLEGVAVRAGHHCAQPVMEHFQLSATVRASLAVYNTPGEIDALVVALHKAIEVLG